MRRGPCGARRRGLVARVNGFSQRFGTPAATTAHACGRVNLIGEHTDYNDGFVLPTPVPQGTHVELTPRGDRRVRVASTTVGGGVTIEYEIGREDQAGDWADYVRGITWVLREQGHALTGFDACVESGIPVGAGLASSAALLVALQRALRSAFDLALDDVALARFAQKAENDFVGARVGIMDPLAASLGRSGEALFIDTRSLATRVVPLPPAIELVVIHSGTGHRHAAGAYNQRRQECEAAAEYLGVPALRDAKIADLDRIAQLPGPLGRRARHVVTENHRVLEAVDALETARLEVFGELLVDSHRSLREDFEVSTPAVDALVQALLDEPGVLGARMTGGGFGGSVVAATRAGTATRVAERAAERYARETGETPVRIVPQAGGAGGPLPVEIPVRNPTQHRENSAR